MGTYVLDLGDGLGNRPSKDSATIFSDEQVIFDTDATEVFVGLQLLVVDKLLELAFSFPHVDEGGDEIDARFIGDHKARFQGLATTQAAEA